MIFPCQRIGQINPKRKKKRTQKGQYQTILSKDLRLKSIKLSRLGQLFAQQMTICVDYFIFCVFKRNSFWRNSFRCCEIEHVQAHWKKKSRNLHC